MQARKTRHILLLLCLMFWAPMCCVCCLAQNSSNSTSNQTDGFDEGIDRNAEDFIQVSLLVAKPGDEKFYSTFGHASIRMVCDTFDLDLVFSYGTVHSEGGLISYLLGQLQSGIVYDTLPTYLSWEKRGITEYLLNLPPSVEIELWKILDNDLSKGKTIKYDPLRESCAKNIFLVLDRALKTSDKIDVNYGSWEEDDNLNLRELLSKYSTQTPWTGWIYGVFSGGSYSNKSNFTNQERLLYPAQLLHQWQQTTINDIKLISKEPKTLSESVDVHPAFLTPNKTAILILIFELFGLLMVIIKKQSINRFLSIGDYALLGVLTIVGIGQLIVMFAPIPNSGWNWSFIVFNPLLLLCWYYRKYWMTPYVAILLVWIIVMCVVPHALTDTSNIILGIAEMLLLSKHKLLLTNNKQI